MRHNWQPSWTWRGSERTCENCGAHQVYDLVSYDRMTGGTWRWRPLVGRCKHKETKTVMAQHTPEPWMVLTGGYVTTTAGPDWAEHIVAEVKKPADANLVATAPTLLKELDNSLAWIAKVAAEHDGDGTGLSEKAMRQFDRSMAAINRAKGE